MQVAHLVGKTTKQKSKGTGACYRTVVDSSKKAMLPESFVNAAEPRIGTCVEQSLDDGDRRAPNRISQRGAPGTHAADA